jgi:hypothetical protein
MRKLAAVLIFAVALAGAPSALASGASTTATESYSTLLHQINAKSSDPQHVIRATVDKSLHHVRATLANGTRPLVSYPASDDKFLVDTLLHHKIPVVYATPKRAAAHHVLRYVAAGVVAVLLLIGVGVWFYTRGRGEEPQDADSPAASST